MTIYMKLERGWHDCMVKNLKVARAGRLNAVLTIPLCYLKIIIIFIIKLLDVFSISNTFSLRFVVLLWETPLQALCHRNCATIIFSISLFLFLSLQGPLLCFIQAFLAS